MSILPLLNHSPAESPDVSSEKQQADLKQSIKDFLSQVRSAPLADEVCPRCGEQLQYVDTTLWFYGEHDTFRIRLPVCRCAE